NGSDAISVLVAEDAEEPTSTFQNEWAGGWVYPMTRDLSRNRRRPASSVSSRPSPAPPVPGICQRFRVLTSSHVLPCVAIAVSLFQSAASGQTPVREVPIDASAHDPRSGVTVRREGSRLTITWPMG